MNNPNEHKLVPWINRLGLLYAFILPLKLSIAYGIFVPLILIWLYSIRGRVISEIRKFPSALITPLIFWIGVCFLSGFFGVDPLNSFSKNLRSLFGFSSIVVFYGIAQRIGFLRILTALLSGQALASIHSVISPALPEQFQRIFLGEVTESGQLALNVIIAFGVLTYVFYKNETRQSNKPILLGVLNLVLFVSFSFLAKNNSDSFVIFLILSLVSFLVSIFLSLRSYQRTNSLLVFFTTLVVPLLCSALLVNLKRGPWFGVTCACILLLSRYHKRWVIPILLVFVTLFSAVTPIRSRIMDSYKHFVIAGGRSEMWQIGVELSAKFPIGIGIDNSELMRSFDKRIPPEHRHFHNNFINILVETGWAGLILYLCWIFAIFKAGLRNREQFPESFMLYSFAAAILSWQIAGIFEYNFGDSEVILLVFILIGSMASLLKTEKVAQ
ncbi:MAG: O-antigen ligase family protein [Deltaproteobacteria bacterium]|nr:O-antigen ligase family protein [Deltaproteobacteria bacterium]